MCGLCFYVCDVDTMRLHASARVIVCGCAYTGPVACVLPGVCKSASAYVLVSVWARTAPGPCGGCGPGCCDRIWAEGERECQEGTRGCRGTGPCWGAGPCQPWVSFLAALSQALRVPGSAALPLPVWALRRRPLWNVFGGRGPGWAQFHWQAGQREGEPGLPHACSPAPASCSAISLAR